MPKYDFNKDAKGTLQLSENLLMENTKSWKVFAVIFVEYESLNQNMLKYLKRKITFASILQPSLYSNFLMKCRQSK